MTRRRSKPTETGFRTSERVYRQTFSCQSLTFPRVFNPLNTFPWVPVVRVSSVVGTQIAQQGGPIAALVLCPTVANVAKVSSGRVLVLISQPSEALPDLSTQFSAFSTSSHGWAGDLGTLVRAVGGRKAELHQRVPGGSLRIRLNVQADFSSISPVPKVAV